MAVRSALTTGETQFLGAGVAASFALVLHNIVTGGDPLVANVGLSILAAALTYAMVVWTGPSVMKRGLKGKDMSKVVQREMYVSASYSLGIELWS